MPAASGGHFGEARGPSTVTSAGWGGSDRVRDNRIEINSHLAPGRGCGLYARPRLRSLPRRAASRPQLGGRLLTDFAVTIPEIGRVAAPSPPLVVLTSTRPA